MTQAPLPKTYFDAAETSMPGVMRAVRKDVAFLRAKGSTELVSSVDSFPSAIAEGFQEQIKPMAADVARRLGIGVDDALGLLMETNRADIESVAANINYTHHAFLNFELAGKRVFYFQDALVDRLVATTIVSDSELLHTPFPACMLVFTSRSAVEALAMFEGAGSGQPMALRYDMPITVIVSELPCERLNGRAIVFTLWQADEKEVRSFVKRQILVKPGRSTEESLRTDWAALEGKTGADQEGFQGLRVQGGEASKIEDTVFFEDGLLLMRLLVNSVLYLASSNPDLVPQLSPRSQAQGAAGKKLNRAERRRQGSVSKLDYQAVGSSLPPLIFHHASIASTGGAQNALRQLQHRVQVRGHWKNQPFGPAKEQRRLIWIEPYFRGPDAAELVTRPYVVG